MNRNSRAKIGRETVEIVDRGWYETGDGQRRDIAHLVADCLSDTKLYTPAGLEALEVSAEPGQCETVFEVVNETSLSAGKRLVVERGLTSTLCLNFASAKNAGGGFLGGSQAQEESLARSSALYASLISQADYYETNRACGTALYTDHMIVSPNVPVFRDDDGEILNEPYLLSMVTSPAVNAGAVARNEPQRVEMIRPTMAERIAKLLAVALCHNYEHLILGAWGCGVFRNDPREIAELFAAALLGDDRFHQRFQSVTFAVLDGSADEQIVGPFRELFQAVGDAPAN